MSWLAANYVLSLDRSVVTKRLKHFLLVLAVHHQSNRKTFWPSHASLAEDLLCDVREIRRLTSECEARDLISFKAGRAKGQPGEYKFLKLSEQTEGAFTLSDRKTGGATEGRTEGRTQGADSSNPIDSTNFYRPTATTTTTQPQLHHGFAALTDWLAIKASLQSKLSPEEYSAWLRPMYLLRVMSNHTLLLTVPAARRVIEAARSNKGRILELAKMRGYPEVCLTVYPDAYTIDRLRLEFPEIYEQLPAALKRKPTESVLA